MSYSATPLVSAADVSGDLERKTSLFKNSLFLNTTVAILAFILMFFLSPLMDYMQQPPDVVALSKPFFNVIMFSMIPVSLFFTCKQYAEGLSNTRAAMYISIIGNVLNIVLNYALIYGKFGLPAIGYMGAAWATFIARCFMGVSFLIYIFYNKETSGIKLFFKKVKNEHSSFESDPFAAVQLCRNGLGASDLSQQGGTYHRALRPRRHDRLRGAANRAKTHRANTAIVFC